MPESHIKNSEQIAFSEMVEELGLKNDAEVARLLKMSRASVSRILSGAQTPRPGTLELLKGKVAEKKQSQHPQPVQEGIEGARNADVKRAADRLDEIHKADPTAFEAVQQVILHTRNSVVKPKANSAALSRAVATAPGALKKALSEGQASSLSRKAGVPTSGKRARGRGIGRRSKSPPASQAQAPE